MSGHAGERCTHQLVVCLDELAIRIVYHWAFWEDAHMREGGSVFN